MVAPDNPTAFSSFLMAERISKIGIFEIAIIDRISC